MKDKVFVLYGYSSGTDGTYFSGTRLFTQNKDFRTAEQYTYYRECGLNTLLLEGNDPYYGETWATSQTKKNMDTIKEYSIVQRFEAVSSAKARDLRQKKTLKIL